MSVAWFEPLAIKVFAVLALLGVCARPALLGLAVLEMRCQLLKRSHMSDRHHSGHIIPPVLLLFALAPFIALMQDICRYSSTYRAVLVNCGSSSDRAQATTSRLLPGCNLSLAPCCERCWLASVAQHPVLIQVVGCCPRSRTICSAMPHSLVMLVRVRVSPLVGEDAPLARCCDGAGDAASCTRSRRAGVAHSSSARSARR
mmetsp:Transcript_43939/g.141736  ORF Transcript_43939/g.141736 Transcript_43939/m.141736 type:complete len:201 (+) Transcript_43939:1699-2301(+)